MGEALGYLEGYEEGIKQYEINKAKSEGCPFISLQRKFSSHAPSI
jgi:hypothetical protein